MEKEDKKQQFENLLPTNFNSPKRNKFKLVLIVLGIAAILLVGGFFVYKKYFSQNQKIIQVQQISSSTTSTTEGSYSMLENGLLIETYGKYPYNVFQNYPELLMSLKNMDNTFSDYDMNVSLGDNKIVSFSDGRQMLFMSGCFPHACSGSKKVALYEPTTKRVYLGTYTFVPKDSSNPALGEKKTIVFLGDPDPLVTKFLYENYYPDFGSSDI